MIEKRLIDGLKNPDVIYRSAPFWSWNDDLKIEQLKYQVDKMKEGGFGGGFMHSRIGLITSYLSDEWMDCIKEVVKYAKENGMKMYLYDEDRWPSGFAGGIVAKKKENRIKILKVWKRGKKWMKKVLEGVKSDWYNGLTYVDTMNEKTINDFIKSTYEKYVKFLKNYIPNTVPAIFTDEPNYFHGRTVNKNDKNFYYFPWTKNLRKIFKSKFGYDIYERINLLIEEKEDYEKVRYDYSRLISELFIENFGENIYNFCEKNRISLTGHYLGEDTIKTQISVVGDVMSLYEFMQWPGVDHLGRNLKNPLTLKQCSSVSNQLGKERVLSELYGCSGQNFTLAERKWIGDWHISLGINFFCPHLYLYSLKGCRKRDFPPTISHHQPYWGYQKELEDYFARLNFIMSQGKFLANILVIHPVETGWSLKGSEKLTDYDEELSQLTQKLLENNFEYEFGSEKLIEKYGEVKDGKFKIGRGEYEYIILPAMTTLREKTLKLIEEFINQGGKVFASEKFFPYLIEGERKDISIKRSCILYSSIQSLIKELKNVVERDFEIYGDNNQEILDIFIHRRKIDEDIEAIFLNNISLDKSYKVFINLKYEGKVYSLDLFNGKINVKGVKKEKKGILIEDYFPPVGSSLFLIDKSESPLILNENRKEEKILKSYIENWKIEPLSENVLVIDMCKFKKKKDKRWSGKMPVLQIQQLFEKENVRQKIKLLFEFENENFSNDLYLVVEQLEKYNLKINNKILKKDCMEEWLDPSFKKIKIPKNYIKRGKNKIEMDVTFIPPEFKNTLIFRKDGIEIENIYLLGNFVVKAKKVEYKNGGYYLNNFTIAVKEKEINEDDINLQGYPFYSGSIKAFKEIEIKDIKKTFLKFEEFKCVVAKIKINEKQKGIVYLPPYEIEITEYLKEGKNIIEIELFSSLRNLLGPHHLKEHNPEFVGPFSFVDWGKKWFKSKDRTVDYSVLPFGIGKICLIEKNG
ncbi:MAG TPA: glycosyl hydrolase [bacterium]|nr:glycosyl hydrolase [bacterium]